LPCKYKTARFTSAFRNRTFRQPSTAVSHSLPRTHPCNYLRSPLSPLPTEKCLYSLRLLRRERNHTPLGKVKHIPSLGMHLLPRPVLERPASLQDDLHLLVRVRVLERLAGLEVVEAGRDGHLVVVRRRHVAEEVVVVRD